MLKKIQNLSDKLQNFFDHRNHPIVVAVTFVLLIVLSATVLVLRQHN